MPTVESPLVRRYSVKRIANGEQERIVDTVAAEEPLEIRASYWFKDARISESLALTMRTPGHDAELAAGFLVSEGIVRERADLLDVRPLGGESSNEVAVELAKGIDFEGWRLARSTFVNSSCGVCGKRSRDTIAEQIAAGTPQDEGDSFRLDASLIERLPALLREQQQGFAQTGGLHAAALVSAGGEIDAVFEDIGRHNALDKLVGWAFLNGRMPLRDRLLLLSSRSSFELIQKAAMAGAPAIATVGGPSSLAIETARDFGITLLGFVRDRRFNVYSGEWRIDS
jgi:FdhD protein